MDKYTSIVMGLIFGAIIVAVGLYYSSEASVVASTELDTIRLYKGDIFKTTVPSNGYLMKVHYILTDTKPAYDVCTINMFGYETVNPATSTLQCIKGSQIMIGTKHYTIGIIDLNFVDLVEVVK